MSDCEMLQRNKICVTLNKVNLSEVTLMSVWCKPGHALCMLSSTSSLIMLCACERSVSTATTQQTETSVQQPAHVSWTTDCLKDMSSVWASMKM